MEGHPNEAGQKNSASGSIFFSLSLSLSHSHTHSHIYLLYSVSSPPTLSRRYTHQRHTNSLSLLSPFSLYNPLSLSPSISLSISLAELKISIIFQTYLERNVGLSWSFSEKNAKARKTKFWKIFRNSRLSG